MLVSKFFLFRAYNVVDNFVIHVFRAAEVDVMVVSFVPFGVDESHRIDLDQLAHRQRIPINEFDLHEGRLLDHNPPLFLFLLLYKLLLLL